MAAANNYNAVTSWVIHSAHMAIFKRAGSIGAAEKMSKVTLYLIFFVVYLLVTYIYIVIRI
jgi:hypothetical protein